MGESWSGCQLWPVKFWSTPLQWLLFNVTEYTLLESAWDVSSFHGLRILARQDHTSVCNVRQRSYFCQWLTTDRYTDISKPTQVHTRHVPCMVKTRILWSEHLSNIARCHWMWACAPWIWLWRLTAVKWRPRVWRQALLKRFISLCRNLMVTARCSSCLGVLLSDHLGGEDVGVCVGYGFSETPFDTDNGWEMNIYFMDMACRHGRSPMTSVAFHCVKKLHVLENPSIVGSNHAVCSLLRCHTCGGN